MSKIDLKNVLIGGFLIFAIDVVIGRLMRGLSTNSFTVLIALIVLFLVAMFTSKVTLSKLDKNSILNGFLQGIVSAILMIIFMSAYNITLIISIVGATVGGYLVSKNRK